GETFALQSAVARDAAGEATTALGPLYAIVRFFRTEAGSIEGMMQGNVLITKSRTAATYTHSANPDVKHWAQLNFDRDGNQVWSGENGTVRVARPDGGIVISRPDGSTTVYEEEDSKILGDRLYAYHIQHIAPAGRDFKEVSADCYGGVEVV